MPPEHLQLFYKFSSFLYNVLHCPEMVRFYVLFSNIADPNALKTRAA